METLVAGFLAILGGGFKGSGVGHVFLLGCSTNLRKGEQPEAEAAEDSGAVPGILLAREPCVQTLAMYPVRACQDCQDHTA